MRNDEGKLRLPLIRSVCNRVYGSGGASCLLALVTRSDKATNRAIKQIAPHRTRDCNPLYYRGLTDLSFGRPSLSYSLVRAALSFSITCFAYLATSSARARGTTITPSPSATITSPGLTNAPPHTTGRLTDSISLRPGRMPRPTWRK